MKKEAKMVFTENMCKVIYIQPSKKEIGEHMIAIGDNDQFARFCNATGLSWLSRYFPSMNKLGECMGDFITKGSNPYLDAAIASHGLRVIPIGQHSYMLALSCDSAPGSLKDGLFCPTRPNFSEIYCGSALIFSVEKYYPGGYAGIPVAEGDHYTQADCPLSVDTVSELYCFDCSEKSSSSYLVASVEESGEIKEKAKVDSLGQIVPGMQKSTRMVSLTVPKYYADTLISLGHALKNESVDFFSIPYDLTPSPILIRIPDFAISILKDLHDRITVSEGLSEEKEG